MLRLISRRRMSSEPPRSIIDSVLYGTKNKNENEVTTHSKKLARGKYVHEMVFHDVKPEHREKYEQLLQQTYPAIAQSGKVHLVGSWRTTIGTSQDQYLHMWEYRGYTGYEECMGELEQTESYKSYLKQLAPLIKKRQNQMCLEFGYWNTASPQDQNGPAKVYELRSYLLKPGNLLEWESHWKQGLEIRKKYCQPVGAWFTQLGQLSLVHHMWVYPSLQNRKESREAAWEQEGWAETVYNTVPLIQDQRTRVMQPLPFSTLK